MTVGMVALFCGIVFLASLIQGISGFAFGMVVLMVLPYIFGYTKALALGPLVGWRIYCDRFGEYAGVKTCGG